ncbi:DUF2306 domain-containing protein [uncultured Maricaulis sp.]|uniref:DUF2306 domain-containing protein n=1 Tax=uncultured Maricaulis sp. TaxID=174710 RepID=UPI0030DC9774|tara:strand:- start:44103 stop:44756 length:654 start_codon:yes stop_codon:yes gene_type:complete
MSLFEKASYSVLVFLCLAVALYASVYYLPASWLEIEGILLLINGFGPGLLALHAGAASIAIVLGPFQFLPGLRQRRPRVHHLIGRLYVTGCFLGGLSGLGLAIGTTFGPLVTIGFGSMAIAWLYTTFRGIHAAMSGQFQAHRRWMLRSFAVTLAAVSLRIFLPLMLMSGVEFAHAYPFISYACWIPNLVLVEIWIRLRTSPLNPARTPHPRSSPRPS